MVAGLTGLPSNVAFRNFIEDPNKQINRFRDSDPAVQRDIAYFKNNIGSIESVDDLLDDQRLSRVVLSAFGLESEINSLGRIRQVLKESPSDPDALANQLADKKFKELAEGLRLDTEGGLDQLRNNEDFQADLIDRFVRNEFEISLGEQDTALRQAAFFARNISDSNSVFDILGDRILRTVIQGALQLPEQIAIQPVETQARAIESRIDISKFLETNLDFSETEVEQAESDASLIEANLEVADAAISQVNFVDTTLQQVIEGFSTLDADTDPAGVNAADIAVQETAVPDLLAMDQLLNAASQALKNSDSRFAQLRDIVDQARSGGDLTTLKAEFSNAITNLKNDIASAEINTVTGTTESLLMAGADGIRSIQVDSSGTTVDSNEFDLTGLINDLDSADSAFKNVTDASDIANISSTLSRLAFADERSTEVQSALSNDSADFDTQLQETEFFATLNTDQLRTGFRSVRDAQNRINDIDNLLNSIADLAAQSADLADGADRTDLQTQFEALRTELRNTIENTNDTGLINFLNGAATQNFEVINGNTLTVNGGFDLATDIADILDTKDLLTAANADDLRISAIQATNDNDAAKLSLDADDDTLNRAFGQFDPRGRLDAEILNLEDALPLITAQAGINGVNLLGAEQSDITVNLETAAFDITLGAINSFESDTASSLDSIISVLSTDRTQVEGILSQLQTEISSAGRRLRSDANQLNFEFAKVGATLDLIAQEEAESAENPYDVNNFTLKFIERFLTLNGGNGINLGNNQDALTSAILGGGSISGSANFSNAGIALSILGNIGRGGGAAGGGVGGIINLLS